MTHKHSTANLQSNLIGDIPTKTTIRSLSISSILDSSNESGLGLRSRDQSFQKFAFSLISTRPRDADNCCVFKSFHSRERFQKFAFSHRFRVDGTWKRNKCLRFQMETDPCGRGLDITP